ncbi:glycosyltransferase family 9 protein [Opitutus sp. ER46]|uniref:glycosyltransferase family 9 protein n=1 Tax=Opitutus sp. ER46 TaxID=2161864 RepID=UPI000D2FA4A9|nr:glycosyltransferase family 9 protein [Opitutus sp. ER46]PTX92605.1 hypothetical protein DB354_14865 [Opitutus sp. ER46]
MTGSSAQPAAARPRTVVCVKVDTLGDLVLFIPALAALRGAWPDTRIAVVIRQAYLDLAPQLVAGVEWIGTSLDPFARGPAADPAELTRLRHVVAALQPDVIAAATSRQNWLETVLAATPGASHRVALGTATDDEFFATQLRVHLGIDARQAFTSHAEFAADDSDWVRGLRLADALLGRAVPRSRPSLSLPAEVVSRPAAFLQQHRLSPGRYVVCAAAGFANVALKTWPAERFAAVLRHIQERHGRPTLLVGQESERPHLEPLAAAAGGDTTLWLGRDGSLPELAALIGQAGLFLGNDTGAMHLAAALDVPVVAVFGGGTWPRFVPAARRHVSVVQPLPCFGCGWDCAFGDAPCIDGISVADVTAAVDLAFARGRTDFAEIRAVEPLPATTREIMGKAAIRYRQARTDHLARQHKLEELTDLDREKDAAIAEKEASIAEKEAAIAEKEAAINGKEEAILKTEAELRQKEASIFEKEAEIHSKDHEIAALKQVCDEREKLIFELDRNSRAFEAKAVTIAADKELLVKTLRELPEDRAYAVETIAGQAAHIRNLESIRLLRDGEIADLKASLANMTNGRQDLEQARHYGRLLAEKEAVIQDLHRNCQAREAVIRQLMAETTSVTGKLWHAWRATRVWAYERFGRPLSRWWNERLVERCWMQIGELRQYPPRPLRWDRRLPRRRPTAALPQIGIVTPSYGQARFLERTLRSVLDQQYPKLRYAVQDGGSKDASPAIIAGYAARLAAWESVPDAGQADAIARGFAKIQDALGAEDVMAWLNSDDLLAPGVLAYVGDYFARHPEVDVLYGHRIIIDEEDREIGRWIMPRHDAASLEWVDYIPQETLFWRKQAWQRVGGIDPAFQFALDWDLLARFQQAGCRMVRVPYFLAAFRVHGEQKTSSVIHTTGAEEMRRIRARFHGDQQDNTARIEEQVQRVRRRGAIATRLLELGIRW